MPEASLERLAVRALERLAPLSFDLATDPAERDAVLRMRYQCVVAEGWATEADFPGGRECDEYEDEATFVVCRDGDEVAGSLRVVLPSDHRPLPTERDFGLRARPAGRVGEVGRIVVSPSARAGRSHLVLAGLCARAWQVLHGGGCDRALSTAAPDVIDLYRALGLRVTVLGPARLHWGVARAPIQIDGDEHTFAFLTT